MKNSIIAFPSDFIKKNFANLNNVFLYDGLSIFNNQSTSFCVSNNFEKLPQELNISDLRKSLNFWNPIIERWCGNLNQYQLIKDKIMLDVCAFASAIKKYDIKNVVFHTGVPHHIDSLTVSLACEAMSVNQIFLYSNVVDSSLIPLLQTGDISTRNIAKHIKTKNKTQEVFLKNFLDNIFEKKKPYDFNEIKKIYKSFSFSIFALIRQKIKFFLRIWLCSLGLLSRNLCTEKKVFDDYSFLSYIRMLYAQKKFIKIYKKKSANTQVIHTNEVRLVIFSSLQPEASSFPEGLYFSSFIDVCLALRSKGYKKKILYKEHYGNLAFYNPIVGVSRTGLFRNSEYLNTLEAIGCEFISESFSNILNINSAKNYLPVTISGTIAFERSLLGLRTLVFGRPWFSEMPGLVKFSEVESLSEINKKWTEPDMLLANSAQRWVLRVLKNYKLINVLGIGSGREKFDEKSRKLFLVQFHSLLKQL
jgi:hypothetical protein